ncbi:MAG: NAD-dependent epimerase/dehydratase family protein [Bacteroidaceae bacterium]|nr:NAD-dependent epimerase/dehydratase family protein [Bacteroidaceae bacterium]
MKILVTGAAGFVGHALTERLLKENHEVVGIDNLNDYYDPRLKLARLARLGLPMGAVPTPGQEVRGREGFRFVRLDIADRAAVEQLFRTYTFDRVVHLAAQAGVRYSIDHPHAYAESNLVGFLHILEGCRQQGIRRLVYASSSSVYGGNERVPFRESDVVDQPVSLYAATKKSNELMAHAYSHLYGIKATGLRFFTVYGPWGRPDMALFLFANAIVKHQPLRLFNYGDMQRDFTYIDDIVEGTYRIAMADDSPEAVYNIGYGQPQPLTRFLEILEQSLGQRAIVEKVAMQPGDVARTWADTTALQRDYGYRPHVSLEDGTQRFAQWFLNEYPKILNA